MSSDSSLKQHIDSPKPARGALLLALSIVVLIVLIHFGLKLLYWLL